jgi:pimeloyl-ACP methyl ester carboxylesterase
VTDKRGTDNFIQANGLRFHYLSWGEPSRPPILMLHGGGQTAHTWQRVANRLADRYYLIAADLRGHGDTQWSPDGEYGYLHNRDDVAGMAEALRLDGYVLVGMSMGGITAMNYAVAHHRDLRGLVVVDVSPAVEEAGAQRIMAFLNSKREFADLDEAVAHARAFAPRRSAENLRQTLPANLRELPDGRLAWKWDPALFNRQNGRHEERRLNQARLWEEVRRISCPTLVVHGRESDILTRENGEALARAVAHGRYVGIDGAGHTVQGDNPHSLSEALERFFAEIAY